MQKLIMNRDDAWALLTEYTKSDSLLKHAMAVEAAVRGYARKFGEDEDAWGITALLHDFDYERWPTLGDHPNKGSEILHEKGYPDWMIRAILSHAQEITGVSRDSLLEKTLFACDELEHAFRHRGVARAADEKRARSRSQLGEKADEGQGVRATPR